MNERLAAALERDLEWLSRVIHARIGLDWLGTEPSEIDTAPPDVEESESTWSRFLVEHDISRTERLALLLALAPSLSPGVLDPFFLRDPATDRGFTVFGGIVGKNHGGFLPTVETALFLLDEEGLSARSSAARHFQPPHRLLVRQWIETREPEMGEPRASAQLLPGRELVVVLESPLHESTEKPHGLARRIDTELEWNDLVLPARHLHDLEEIMLWSRHGREIRRDWGLSPFIRRGFVALFHGPPGTGKTLAATLVGKTIEREVYRVDLSMVVSKYIGETEKHLHRVFDDAERNECLLFFDEADSLFSSRSGDVQTSNDRYANLQVAYLLQRIEDFSGIAILATNLRSNIDAAFARRLQCSVEFPVPGPADRLRIWQRSLGPALELDSPSLLEKVSAEYDLTGGQIVNVIRSAALRAADRGQPLLAAEDLMRGIAKELEKQGRTL